MAYVVAARHSVLELRARYDATVPVVIDPGTPGSGRPITHRVVAYGRQHVIITQPGSAAVVTPTFKAAFAAASNSLIGNSP